MTSDADYRRHFTRDDPRCAPHVFFATRPLYCAAVRNTDDDHACRYTPYLQYYLHEALFARYASR